MDYKDYYKVMGVERDATQDDIKRAYRKLARKYHPDVSKEKDAEKQFKELGEAYEVLKDPEKRAAYNELGANWQAGQDFRPPPNWDAGFEFSGGGYTDGQESAYSDFFESLFGQGFRTSQDTRTHSGFHARGQDHHAKIVVDVKDAFQGAVRSISLKTPEIDPSGHMIYKERTLNVKIPKGVKQGQKIRLAGQGAAGMGKGASGDLYLDVEFAANKTYRVQGRDVYMEVPITPWEAALGSTIKVPTPVDTVDLKIPPSVTSGRKLRLKGKGIPGNPAGDLYVSLQFALPSADNPKAKEMYSEMEQKFSFNPRSSLGV